jgi:hypothetical protein
MTPLDFRVRDLAAPKRTPRGGAMNAIDEARVKERLAAAVAALLCGCALPLDDGGRADLAAARTAALGRSYAAEPASCWWQHTCEFIPEPPCGAAPRTDEAAAEGHATASAGRTSQHDQLIAVSGTCAPRSLPCKSCQLSYANRLLTISNYDYQYASLVLLSRSPSYLAAPPYAVWSYGALGAFADEGSGGATFVAAVMQDDAPQATAAYASAPAYARTATGTASEDGSVVLPLDPADAQQDAGALQGAAGSIDFETAECLYLRFTDSEQALPVNAAMVCSTATGECCYEEDPACDVECPTQ